VVGDALTRAGSPLWYRSLARQDEAQSNDEVGDPHLRAKSREFRHFRTVTGIVLGYASVMIH